MENLTITKANALKAHQAGDANQKKFLETLFPDIVKTEPAWKRVKSFEDAMKLLGFVDPDAFFLRDTPDERAYKKLKMLAEIWREGWTPDWSNPKQGKYYPWFEVIKSGSGLSCYVFDCTFSATRVGSRLCFPTAEMATAFGKQFLSLYEDYLLIK